jgi:hypothetical protein
MTGCGRIPPLIDDSSLPDQERVILERARALIPLLAERAPAATAARQLPARTIAEYRHAGILRILQPTRFGGLQGRFSLFSRIVEELTYGCASSAWVYAVLAEHQWIIAQYPEQAQIDVWGEDPLAVASSSLAPREAARRVPGGWRLSGHYPFSSGCDYAQWAIIGTFLGEKGDPRGIAYLLVRLTEAEIVDDWQVLGLLGTGSKSLVLRDVYVPEHRSVLVSDLFAGTPPGAWVYPDYPVIRAPRTYQAKNQIATDSQIYRPVQPAKCDGPSRLVRGHSGPSFTQSVGEPGPVGYRRKGRRILRARQVYRRCGSIEIEAGRSLPTKIGRRTCE